MQLFKDFGFEPTFFVAQIINFLILAFIFKKYLYKPVLKTLKDRQKKIAQGIKDAEDAHNELATAEERKDEIIRAATTEAEKIIDETKKAATEMRDELTEKAKQDAAKIIAESKIAAKEEADKLRKEAKDAAFDVSKKIVEKILSEIFTTEERKKIVARDVKKLADYE